MASFLLVPNAKIAEVHAPNVIHSLFVQLVMEILSFRIINVSVVSFHVTPVMIKDPVQRACLDIMLQLKIWIKLSPAVFVFHHA